MHAEDVGSDEDDSDFIGDEDDSEEDEEAVAIKKKFKELKRKMRTGQAATLDDVIFEGPVNAGGVEAGCDEDGNVTPYGGSSSDESVEIDSDGELKISSTKYARYNKTDLVVKF